MKLTHDEKMILRDAENIVLKYKEQHDCSKCTKVTCLIHVCIAILRRIAND